MGFAIGAVLYVMGIAALLRFAARKVLRASQLGPRVTAASYILAWPITIPIVAYGFADGGPPQWVFAATAYLPVALMGSWVSLATPREVRL